MLTLRPMDEDDLVLVERWLAEPHVARWWPAGPDVAGECATFRRRIRGKQAVHMLTIEHDARPVGWCQWYRWGDEPDAAEYGAAPDDVGIDYAIGEAAATGQGLGAQMVAALVALVRTEHPDADLLTDVSPDNHASRRVLERNGFVLVETRPVAAAPAGWAAMYRLSGRSRSRGTPAPR